MEKIGVEAVITGLTSFLGGMDKMDASIRKLIPGGDLLSRAFDGIKGAVKSFGESILHVAEYAIGQLLADAIKGVISLLQELAAGVMESADTFQKLEIRLGRLNFNAAKASGMDYNAAMEESIKLTKEQIDWTIKLGAITPYDASDIANIYTLARGYGFSADEAKSLTDATIEFTSGMGLSNEEMERIIINFGQLSQQGKLNGQDIRDLARGAYVPVNRVLEMTAEKLGMTTEEFAKARKAGTLGAEAVDAFRQSFVELVGVDFEGASQALGNVFSVAAENVKALIQDMLGLKVVAPILLQIGTWIQSVTDALAGDEERWARFETAVERIGTAISKVVAGLLGLAPSADSIAEAVTVAMEKIATWLEENQDGIVKWVEGAAKSVGAFIDKVVAVWNKLSAWVAENAPIIKDFFQTLGEIVGDVFGNLFGDMEIDFSLEGVLESVKKFMEYVIANKDAITNLITEVVKIIATFEIFATVLQTLIKIGVFIVGVLLTVAGAITLIGLGAISTVSIIMGLMVAFAALIALLIINWDELKTTWNQLGVIIKYYLGLAGESINQWAANTRAAIIAWVNGTLDSISLWATMTWTSIQEWVLNVKYAIMGWVAETKQGFIDWKNSVVQSIVAWAAQVGASINLWVSTTMATFAAWVEEIKQKFVNWKNSVIGSIVAWAAETKSRFLSWVSEIKNISWSSIGTAIVSGIKNGVLSMGSSLISAVVQVGLNAYNALKKALGAKSPSKLFMQVGMSIDQGLVAGILGMAKEVGSAMQTVMGEVTAPAMSSSMVGSRSVSNTYQYTTTNNLNVHTSARSEPIIQDFNMMSSLQGA